MIINVDDLVAKNLDLHYEERQDGFDALAGIENDGGIKFAGSIQFDLHAYRVGELIVVDGNLEVPVRLTCVRCLSDFDTILSADFKLTYTRHDSTPNRKPDPAEIELHRDEIGLLPFFGQHLDLKPALQEELIMALPMRPVCRDSCKGLCPRCGADLNKGPCGCRSRQGHPKFAVLKKLKPQSQVNKPPEDK